MALTEQGTRDAVTAGTRNGLRQKRTPRQKRQLAGYLFVLPAVLYLLVFMMVPLVRGIGLSFTNAKLINPAGGRFVGADNYATLLNSGTFWNSLAATLTYTLATVVAAVFFGTLAAIFINRSFPGRGVIRAIMTFPYAMPTIAASLVFIWIYNQSAGVLNTSLQGLGIGEVGWLTDPKYGMFSVILTTVWKVFPFVMLVMLAALQSVPDELFEASKIDGADSISTFRAIVLPHLMPTIRIVALLMTIWSIRRFEIIYLLTGGGPIETTNTLVVNIYRTAFSSQQLGVAATIGALGLVLSLAVTTVFFLIERRETQKEDQA